MNTKLLYDRFNATFFSQQDSYAYRLKGDVICQNILIESEGKKKPHDGLIEGALDAKLIFLETFFNPISRIKRGKIYELEDNSHGSWHYLNSDTLTKATSGNSAYTTTFQPYRLSRNDFNLKKTSIYFGSKQYKSKWRILAIDYDVANEEIFVLQEVNGLGVIPNLDETKIDPRYYAEISQHYSRLFNEINSAPETVIDICRAVATSLLSAKLALVDSDRDDLGVILRKLTEVKDATDGATQKKYFIARSCAEIINRLHPRGKPNEVVKHDLRKPLFADADFAVQALFQIIREFEFDN